MDTILKGILVAEKPQAIKNEIIQKIVQQASQRHDDAVVAGVLNTCIAQILDSDNEFICTSCKNVRLSQFVPLVQCLWNYIGTSDFAYISLQRSG